MANILATIRTEFSEWQYRDDEMKRQRFLPEGHPWQGWHAACPAEMTLAREVAQLKALNKRLVEMRTNGKKEA